MTLEEHLQLKGYCVIDITADQITLGDAVLPYTMVAFCTRGQATMEMNNEEVIVREGTRFCYTHIMMVRLLKVSPDFHATLLVMRDDLAFDAVVGLDTKLIQSLYTAPCSTIDDREMWHLVIKMIDVVRHYSNMHFENLNSAEIPSSLFRSIMIVLSESVRDQVHHPYDNLMYSMADKYFRTFINLLNEHVRLEHEVAFYAAQLNITAKYLNEICKHKSGHKAKEMISSILMTLIKRELLHTSKSLKEVATEFGFADQSSLGKFFKKHARMSPLTYRRELQN